MQIPVLHLSKDHKVWDTDAQGPWVSKTDLVEFEQCGYRVFLAHQQKKRYDEFRITSALQSLLSGQAHEQSVQSKIRIVETEDIETARAKDGLYKVPIRIYNHDYGMVGILDAIRFKENVLLPVEIKTHSRFRALDRQELAFYWRLLEPLQSKDVPKEKRRGYVFLGQSQEPREVLLRRRDLRESELKVPKVRDAKVTDPGFFLVKECRSCIFEEEHKAEAKRRLALDLVYDVGPIRKKYFHELGIYTVGDLAHADPVDLLRRWSEIATSGLPVQRLAEMQAHADSLLSGEPKILDSAQIPLPTESIVLDLEYSTWAEGYIFLVGMLIVGNDKQVSVKQEFAVDSADERRILESMNSVLASYPAYQIVTWSGLSADFPEIEKAWARNNMPRSDLDDFKGRHVDLFQRAVRGVRLPIPELGLKAVSDHFTFKRKVFGVSDGLDALMMYMSYRSTKDERLRTKLMMYNQDDLNATLFVWEKLWELASQSAAPHETVHL